MSACVLKITHCKLFSEINAFTIVNSVLTCCLLTIRYHHQISTPLNIFMLQTIGPDHQRRNVINFIHFNKVELILKQFEFINRIFSVNFPLFFRNEISTSINENAGQYSNSFSHGHAHMNHSHSLCPARSHIRMPMMRQIFDRFSFFPQFSIGCCLVYLH